MNLPWRKPRPGPYPVDLPPVARGAALAETVLADLGDAELSVLRSEREREELRAIARRALGEDR